MPAQPKMTDRLSLRPEQELVVCCARTRVDEQTSERIRVLLQGTIDWEFVYRFALTHFVLPLLHPPLSTIEPASVPPEQLSRFKDYYQKNAGRNLYLTGELSRILVDFAAAGIEAIPYKGPVLALFAYGKLELRRFVDLDIMVRKADVLRAKELLVARGYQCGVALTDAQQSLLLRTQHNFGLSRDQGRMIVELHWEVASDLFASSFQAEQLWDRLEPLRLLDFTVKSLSDVDLFLSTCVHGSKHLWTRLEWICDVAEMLRTRTDLDWREVWERARLTGTERMMLLALYLAHHLLDAPLPADLKANVASDEALALLAQKVYGRLFRGAALEQPTFGESFKFNMGLRPDWRSRMRYCRFLLRPTDGDVRALQLPRPLSFAYYIMRPFRLFRADRERRFAG